jgi:alpha-tubulin suppressor-like RCC1 family protein
MRLRSARFACLAAALLAAPACNAIFGISSGQPEKASGSGGGGGATSTAGHGVTSSSSTSGTGGHAGAGGSSSAGTGGAGGASCNHPGNATCAMGVLTICDGTGHEEPPQDCGAAALCDPVGKVCTDYGTLSVGTQRACAFDTNHDVYCWGLNRGTPTYTGSLVIGNGQRMFPAAVAVTGISAWQLAVGDYHQCALQENGDVTCWGSDEWGQIGLPTSMLPLSGNTSNPKVPLAKPAVQVGAASDCSCARLDDGTVWCWGLQDDGCLGDGGEGATNSGISTPVQVALGQDAVQIAIGDGRFTPSCARLKDTSVACWGLGFTPTPVLQLTGATDLAVGSGLVFIADAGGVSYSLPVGPSSGAGGGGGGPTDGGTTAWTMAAPAPYLPAGSVSHLSAGFSFCGLEPGGVPAYAELHDIPPALPQTVTPAPAAEIACGYGQYAPLQCLKRANVPFAQSIYCWGDDTDGDLGVEGLDYPGMPQTAAPSPNLASPVSTLSCGQTSTAVVLTDGSAHYWGATDAYLGGGGDVTTASAMLSALGSASTRVRVMDDYPILYALQVGAAAPLLLVSGNPVSGQRLLRYTTTSFVDVVPGFLDREGNAMVDLGLLANGQVIVYSDPAGTMGAPSGNDFGIFGDGTHSTPSTPTIKPVPLPAAAIAIAAQGQDSGARYTHACAVLTTGALYCWGDNEEGECGDNAAPLPIIVSTPYLVTIPGAGKIVSVATGDEFTCATDGTAGTGKVYCWGENIYYQLGHAVTPPAYAYFTPVPGAVDGITNAMGVVAGDEHACAWLADGTAVCWGDNDFGQLGDGTFIDRAAPVPVKGLTGVQSLSAGQFHTCALLTGGGVACWGSSAWGQGGTGQDVTYLNPTMVQGL